MAYEHTWRTFSFDTYSYLFDEDNERRDSMKNHKEKNSISDAKQYKILSLRPIQFVSAGVLTILNADALLPCHVAMSTLFRRANCMS